MENDARGTPEANVSPSRYALPVVAQSLGIPVEEYLARADTKALLSSPTLTKIPSYSEGNVKNNVVAVDVVGAPAPKSVQVVVCEPRSSKFVSELHRLCQTRLKGRLVPLFEIELCDDKGATWGGNLIVGDRTISRGGEMRWQSKKAAKEGLAELGVGVVRGMMKSEDGDGDEEAKNWGGMLQGMYCTSHTSLIFSQNLPQAIFQKRLTLCLSVSNPQRLPRCLHG